MVYFSAVGMVNALGNSVSEVSESLRAGQSLGMAPQQGWLLDDSPVWLGAVNAELPPVPESLLQHNSRNNRLLLAALQQIQSEVAACVIRYGASRVAVIMGTSTSGIFEGERAVREYQPATDEDNVGGFPAGYDYQQQELGDPSIFLARYLGLTGPSYTLSTACSSSVRAIISGQRLIESGMVDAAIVGGADSLCRMPINGFHSLESLSAERCTPFAAERKGINVGEAAALILLSREPAPVALLGVGESSDAWHMSAPHPEGRGAEHAIRMALSQAELQPAGVGYINLHGTATRLNDQIEAQVVNRIFGHQTPCSSTKHLTGHTLGAAGATEAALSWLMLSHDLPLPVQDFTLRARDQTLAEINLVTGPEKLKKPVILSNSFAFGGNNACLILGAPNGEFC
ncbi:3-oxoacyl-ACP synthase [Yersinia frederiksenii]|uniref:beta-ketoacyl-[acyl-carrier-protein] synthase family protein n=1 Tax=Yersinia frederiksenii TaxID=29484 RepID=UPI0005E7727D|nr:beta-ketoacyl-[acyl-carrier-protein] synthase family protein [Yersinia frederiksenii]CFR13838.1 3-oxoacyl-ACP synthase [Yersinia frederiksenii]